MGRWTAAATLAVVLATLAPSPSAGSASTVSESGSRVSFTDGKGEVNALSMSLTGGGAGIATFSETAGKLTANAPCGVIAPGVVRCPLQNVDRVTVRLGAGDDTATVTSNAARNVDLRLAGEEGNDTITGSDGRETLVANLGSDTLRGGGGDDLFQSDEGSNPHDPDVMDGGPGEDTLDDQKVFVDFATDLGAGTVTVRGRADQVSNIEGVLAGPGDNVLVGGPGDDSLWGFRGDDVIKGGAGDDELEGGFDTNRLEGGAGDDELGTSGDDEVVDGGTGNDEISLNVLLDTPALVRCGAGTDLVDEPSEETLVAADCERVSTLWIDVGAPRLTGTRARFALSCVAKKPCRGRLAVSRKGSRTALGAATYSVGAKRSGAVVVDLGSAAGRLLSAKNGFVAVVRVGPSRDADELYLTRLAR